MSNIKNIELLAPAKNLECGIAAIDHGADAVYIGAKEFGARALAGNSLDDIKKLCDYAHKFLAKVYVTVNTIVYNDELSNVSLLLTSLANIGVDAVLVQDMSVLDMLKKHPELQAHASTQTDNRNADKVSWLKSIGFNRVVLARELSVDEIKTIHQAVPGIELEVFVHGALCVSYSGACYASQYCFGRSANRGACAQFCRLEFNLIDDNGNTIEHNRHLLSLKDMAQIDSLEEIMRSGACSLKIEGRLKDISYVKNVVAAYNQRINAIVDRHPNEFKRASLGHVSYTFIPNLSKTFNRGFTHYFLHGRQPDIASFDTPKAMGQFVGVVKEVRPDSFNVAGTASFANGDGLCFINSDRKLEGFRVNKVHNNRLFPFKMPLNLRAGMALYRNNDQAFEALLGKKTACRLIPISLSVSVENKKLIFSASLPELNMNVTLRDERQWQPAQKPQRENIERQLSKMGGTIFTVNNISVSDEAASLFVPSSILAELRRQLVEQLNQFLHNYWASAREKRKLLLANDNAINSNYNAEDINVGNISNYKAQQFYKAHHIKNVPYAYEINGAGQANATKQDEVKIMTCRYCIRYALGHCIKHGGSKPTWKEPLFLQMGDGRHFRLSFECDKCQMSIYAKNK